MAQCPERCVRPQGSPEVGLTDPDLHGMSWSQHRDPPVAKDYFGGTVYVFMFKMPTVFLMSVSVP